MSLGDHRLDGSEMSQGTRDDVRRRRRWAPIVKLRPAAVSRGNAQRPAKGWRVTGVGQTRAWALSQTRRGAL